MLRRLKALKGRFWTDIEELKEEIESKGFWVEEYTHEYFMVYTDEEDYEDTEWVINLITAGRTITIDSIEEIQ